MKKFIIIWALLLVHSLVFGQVVVIENNTSVGSCTPSTQNVYFYKSGITGSFTVKLYQVIDRSYFYSGCSSNNVTEVASANGSTSPLVLSIPANLEETKSERPFGSGSCFLSPPYNYYYRTVSYYLKIVSDVNSNLTNQRSFGIGGSCQTPGVADMNIPQPNICPGNNVTINFNHNGVNVSNTFTIAIGSDFNSPLVSTTIAGNTATSATLTIPVSTSNSSYGVRISTTNPVSVVTYNSVVQVSTSYCPPPSPPTITANPTTVCAGENVSLTATGCTGTVNWSDGGTGSTRTTTFSSSNTLTATCTQGGTSGNSNGIPITLNPLPSAPTASGVSINSGSTASITASGCTTYKWYESSENGGGFLFTGNPFVSPVLTTNTIYAVACESVSNCISNRTSVAVTVASPPAQPANFTTSTNAVCQGLTGVVYTVPNVNGVTYNWSYSGTGATINGSGNSVLIDFANNATSGTLSVTATNSAGTSPARTLAITVNAVPSSAPTASSITIASGNTASLTATGCSTYNWYGQATGGTLLQSAATAGFTTPTLNSNTTYFVACANGTCESGRTSVLVTVTGGSSAVLVAHYPFCGNANDATANANNGTVNGATLTADRFGNANSAYNFNGTSNYISVADNSVFRLGTNNFSTSIWFKSSSNSAAMVLYNKSEDTGFPYAGINAYLNTDAIGHVRARTDYYNAVEASGSFNDGNWRMMTFTRNGFVNKIFIDGVLKSTQTGTNLINVTQNIPLSIGKSSSLNALFFDGQLDDFKLYNGVLSDAEILAEFNSTGGVPTISSNSPVCVGSTLNLTSTPANSYIWTGVNGFASTAQNPNIASVTSLATGTYMITVTNAGGCVATATTSVTISTSGTPTANGVTITSGNTASITASGCTIYKWYDLSTGNGLLFTGNPFVSPALTTNTTYYVACADAPCPETSRTAVLVTVSGGGGPPQPGAIVGGNAACQGRAGLNYSVTAVPGATSYTWTYSGTGATFVGGINNTRSVTVDFSYTATSGTMSVTANNANGSSPASIMAITVSTAPPAPMANGVTIASGNPASLTATGCSIYKWYSQATGGTVTFTGQNFTTPPLTSTTNYYVACNPGTSCESPRVLVTVTVPCTQMVSVKTGAWNDPTVWSCNRIPTATDNVIVETGHLVTVPAGTFQVKNVTDKGTLGYALNGILNILGGS